MAEEILLKRLGQASEIVRTVVFLVSDDASFIRGTEGGLTVNTVQENGINKLTMIL